MGLLTACGMSGQKTGSNTQPATTQSAMSDGAEMTGGVDIGPVAGRKRAAASPEMAPPQPQPQVTQEQADSGGALRPDPTLPAKYVPRGEIRDRRLESVGSDTMDRLVYDWEREFVPHHAGLVIRHEGKGSSTAPSALAEETADIGPMSRKIRDKERDEFASEFGYPPTQLRTAIDALAVFVHPENPLAQTGMSLKQVDAIFSSTLHRGAVAPAKTWGDVGLDGEWADKEIVVYSRNKASGTYGYFNKVALKDGTYKESNRELDSSAAVVAAVAGDKYAIGYSGIGYATPKVRAAPLAEQPNGPTYAAEAQYAYSGDYPLARFLYLTVNHDPNRSPGVSTLVSEFMRYVYTQEGQQVVIDNDFFPVSADIAREDLKKIGVDPGF
jgi:phosphate transport system substrate-binding protein